MGRARGAHACLPVYTSGSITYVLDTERYPKRWNGLLQQPCLTSLTKRMKKHRYCYLRSSINPKLHYPGANSPLYCSCSSLNLSLLRQSLRLHLRYTLSSCFAIIWRALLLFSVDQRCWNNTWWWIKSRIFRWYHGERPVFVLNSCFLINLQVFRVLHSSSSYDPSMEPPVWSCWPKASHLDWSIWYIGFHVPIWTFKNLWGVDTEVRASYSC